MPIIELNGQPYTMCTNLRVAYKIQGQYDHKPYMDIFKDIENLRLEEQIAMLYASLEVGNQPVPMSKQQFLDYALDNFDLAILMDLLMEVLNGIMGKSKDQDEAVTVVITASDGTTKTYDETDTTKNS